MIITGVLRYLYDRYVPRMGKDDDKDDSKMKV